MVAGASFIALFFSKCGILAHAWLDQMAGAQYSLEENNLPLRQYWT
jgi:hypothetical protein